MAYLFVLVFQLIMVFGSFLWIAGHHGHWTFGDVVLAVPGPFIVLCWWRHLCRPNPTLHLYPPSRDASFFDGDPR